MISRKLDIQRIIQDNSKSIFQKNKELKKIVDNVLEQKTKNTQNIQKIAKIVEQDSEFNLSAMERVKNQVLCNLDLFNKQIDSLKDKNYDLQLKISMATLSQILRNQLNQFSISFVDSFEQAIASNFYLFQEIFQQQIFKRDFIKIKYDNLQDHHFTDILKLAQTISDIPYNQTKQIQSYKNTHSLFSNFLNRISQKETIQHFLMKYPIFEMIPQILSINELKFKLLKSNYDQSSYLFQIQNQDTLQAQIDHSTQQLQAFCDFIINPTLKYIFQIEISQNANRQNLKFGFGLGRDSLVNHNLYEQKLMYYCDGQWGVDKVVKGQNLTMWEVSRNIHFYTIKLCLQENIFEVLDSVENNNIASINQESTDISKLKDLRFFVNLSSKYKKSDWIKIQSIEVVNQFI
ncbi:hypothetical protein ABPG74_010013 [Tetrahymena malaccensis]